MPIVATNSNEVVQQGATIQELAVMFKMDARDVRARLKLVLPRGMRNGKEYWGVDTAATHLVKFTDENEDLVERILNMNPNSLPRGLTKEFNAGLVSRLNLMERTGRVWSTEAVIDTATMICRLVRLQLNLMTDQVERESSLTEPQRETIQRIIDSTLEQMRTNLGNHLRARRRDTRGKAFALGEAEDDGLPDH